MPVWLRIPTSDAQPFGLTHDSSVAPVVLPSQLDDQLADFLLCSQATCLARLRVALFGTPCESSDANCRSLAVGDGAHVNHVRSAAADEWAELSGVICFESVVVRIHSQPLLTFKKELPPLGATECDVKSSNFYADSRDDESRN